MRGVLMEISAKIYTSYFENLENLPSDVVPIAICVKSPEDYLGLEYKKLAPKRGFFNKWKYEGYSNEYCIEHFNAEVLSGLDPHNVVKELLSLSQGKSLAMLCYEKPGEFCHRFLVSDWLNSFGYAVEEYRA